MRLFSKLCLLAQSFSSNEPCLALARRDSTNHCRRNLRTHSVTGTSYYGGVTSKGLGQDPDAGLDVAAKRKGSTFHNSYTQRVRET